jgi:hypothetical protein
MIWSARIQAVSACDFLLFLFATASDVNRNEMIASSGMDETRSNCYPDNTGARLRNISFFPAQRKYTQPLLEHAGTGGCNVFRRPGISELE